MNLQLHHFHFLMAPSILGSAIFTSQETRSEQWWQRRLLLRTETHREGEKPTEKGRNPQIELGFATKWREAQRKRKKGGLPMYVATRGLYRMKPPTIIVPKSIKEDVEKLFEVHRKLDQSELKHKLIGLDVGEEFSMRRDLKVKAFKTYHVIDSQGYIVYSVKQKLKKEYLGLHANDIKGLKFSGVEITYTITEPEVAFTGDTMSDFIVDESNTDVLRAKILVMETTFVENSITVEHAREYGHTHLFEVIVHAERFNNKAILLIHFSARYTSEEIQKAVSELPPTLAGRVFALTEGF